MFEQQQRRQIRAAIGALLLALGQSATALRADTLQTVNLSGTWSLNQAGQADSIEATVPGSVHIDLLAAGKIEDPFFGDNAAKLKWVADATWAYSRDFDISPELLAKKNVVLRCEGLDTAATLTLNGRPIGQADNMFRTWEFDVRSALKPGKNRLVVTFTPFQKYSNDFAEKAKGTGPNTAYRNMANIRKATYSNGWDFGPALPQIGIYRPIPLLAYDETRLKRVVVDAQVEPGQPATVRVAATLPEQSAAGVRIRATISLDGQPVITTTGKPDEREIKLNIASPKLWWPNGMGERPMYHVKIEALNAAGQVLDTQSRRIGLRKIELLPKTDDRPLRLRVNGREVFSRGASWIPSDMFLTRITLASIRSLLADAAAVNMNTIRTWGGGYYEEEAFYDACDEFGLMVWHDYKFACNAYPGKSKAFAENVTQEVIDQTSRLSSHPSLAVWCGNNEVEAIVHNYALMSQAEYDHFFYDIIGGMLKSLLPNANYVGGSPEKGDEHNWWVWHVGANFEKYRESHGWMTEFGFQSFPVPATINSFTTPSDRDSVLSPVMKAHQHNGNKRGNEMILNQIDRYFRPAKDFESTLWLSQINQAYGLSIGIDHWRSDWPKSSGALVWQLNDCWPGTTWSTIDYFGRWKAMHYVLRHEFAPVLVTGVFDPNAGTLPLRICSDLAEPFNATVRWQATDTAGTTIASGENTIDVPAGTTAVDGPTLNLADELQRAGRGNLLVWVDVLRDGQVVSSRTFMPAKPKELSLQDPGLKLTLKPNGRAFDIEITAARPALWAWIDLPGDPDARLNENFVHVQPGKPRHIKLTPSKPINLVDLKEKLIVRSLFDTAQMKTSGTPTLPSQPESTTTP